MTVDIGDVSQLITALAAVGALAFSMWNTRKIKEVHDATNSMKDELVAVTRTAALAEGLKQGQEESK